MFLLGASTDYRVALGCFLSCLCQPEFNMYPGLCSLLGLLYSQSCEEGKLSGGSELRSQAAVGSGSQFLR